MSEHRESGHQDPFHEGSGMGFSFMDLPISLYNNMTAPPRVSESQTMRDLHGFDPLQYMSFTDCLQFHRDYGAI